MLAPDCDNFYAVPMPARFYDRSEVPIVYHVRLDDMTSPMCTSFEEGDFVVPLAEALDPQGRHYNCPDCNYLMMARAW